MKRYLFVWIFWLIGGCVDPYQPPSITAPNTYLVVDGFLHGGVGRSTIKLSRTQNLSEKKKRPLETNASVRVESEKGESYGFDDQGDGSYILTNVYLEYGQKYRVRIKTANGREYLSDYETVRRTPKIDDISWQAKSDGLQIYVSAHDEQNNTRFYRWEYEETWEFYSAFYAHFEYLNKQFVYRSDNINHCWRTENSTHISIGSSEKLTQDVITRFPLVFISNSASNRLKVRYSLLVRQYSLTAEAFEYWQNLKRNTESLGSLFDPQPFQVIGNIHGVTDPDEPVVGYLSSCSVEEQRIFIDPTQLPPPWRIPTGYEACVQDTFLVSPPPHKVAAADMAQSGWIPISRLTDPEAYLMGPPSCIDCRTAGSNVKPSFW